MKQLFRTLGLGLLVVGSSLAWAQDDITEVTFWGAFFNPDEVATLERITENFNAQNPDINVTFELVPGSETEITRLMTAVAAGTGPDIYYLDRFTAAERAESGLLTDLAPFIEAEEGVSVDDLRDQYLGFAWDEVSYDGGIWAFPFDTDTRALYYRRDILEDAGVDLSLFDPANGPMDLETFQSVAFSLNETDESGAYTRVGSLPWTDQGWHVTWGLAYGGAFAEGSCNVTPTDEGVVSAFEFLYNWSEAMGPQQATAFEQTYIPRGLPPQQHPFLSGRMPMTITGDFFLGTITEYAPDLDYDVTYIPSATGEPFSWSGGFSLAVPAGADSPDAAYAFIRYATGPEGQRLWSGDTGRLPTLASLIGEPDLIPGERDFYLDILPVSDSRFSLPVGARYWDELTSAQESVVLNQREPLAALERVETRVQPRLDSVCSQ